jgi:hypothetical protein
MLSRCRYPLIVAAGACLVLLLQLSQQKFLQHLRSDVRADALTQTPIAVLNAADKYEISLDYYRPNFLPEGNWDRRILLTQEAQAVLREHQNPVSCSGKQFILVQNWRWGMGSNLHALSAALAFAIENNKILLYDFEAEVPYGGHLAHGDFCGKAHHSLDCFYMPISTCSRPKGVKLDFIENPAQHQMVIPKQFLDMVAKSGAVGDVKYWWRTQAVAYAMRLNSCTSKFLMQHRAAAGMPPILPPNTVSIHVRHGDKAREMHL